MRLVSVPLRCVFIALIFAVLPSITAVAAEEVVRDDLAPVFAEQNISGGFVLYDPSTEQMTLVNQDWCRLEAAPASTFKIINAMMALDTRAVTSTRRLLPYGGGETRIAAWAKDMNLGAAVRASNVPIFQGIAKRIGLETYRKRLAAIGYGNADVGSDVTTFWLNGPLAISPIGQAKVLSELALGRLGFTDRASAFIRSATLVAEDKATGRKLYGKTGWNMDARPATGWFVGWVEDGQGQVKSFALLAEIRDQAAADKRVPLATALLKALEAW